MAIAGLGWATVLAAADRAPDTMVYVLAAIGLGVIGVIAVAVRCRRSGAEQRLTLHGGGILLIAVGADAWSRLRTR